MKNVFYILLLLCLCNCTKKVERPQSPVVESPRSSEKGLASFVIKAADNPTVASDIEGKISADSVLLEFPRDVDLSHLVPTIGITGKAIEPANKTTQDFTRPVSYKITADDGSTKTYAFRVEKIGHDTASFLLGSWRLVKDSVSNNNYFTPSGGYLLPGVYQGISDDYYRFQSTGIITVHENNFTRSVPYKVLSTGQVDIEGWTQQYGPATIQTLTETDLILNYNATGLNGGTYHRGIYLHRP
ncbi:DUF5018 domain-containing protein [Flavisolibacter nicotianae]|uniref:hypothetical protein n=1 Tax=Flavisolibacter nicotianae TaxID=2364882 RepID=UPI000EB41C8B|nr:hypothetical protein [Flavisolibacter nicotianae]